VQVPLEDILSLASSLANHLLDHGPVSDPSSPPRKTRSRRGASAEPEGATTAAGMHGSVKGAAPSCSACHGAVHAHRVSAVCAASKCMLAGILR
jgi:hypothetical protein